MCARSASYFFAINTLYFYIHSAYVVLESHKWTIHRPWSVRGIKPLFRFINHRYKVCSVRLRARARARVYHFNSPKNWALIFARDKSLGRVAQAAQSGCSWKDNARAMRECKWSRWKACRALSGVLRIPCVSSLEKSSAHTFIRQVRTWWKVAVASSASLTWCEFCIYIVITVRRYRKTELRYRV